MFKHTVQNMNVQYTCGVTTLPFFGVLQLAEEAGIPAGVFNVLPCSRAKAGEVTDVIMNSDLVTNFSFTGSTTTGQVCIK